MIRKNKPGIRMRTINRITSVSIRTNIARLTNVDSRLLAFATDEAIRLATPTGVNLQICRIIFR